MTPAARVFVAGHRGLVGSALCRRLQSMQIEALVAGRGQLDLRDAHAVSNWFARERPEFVFLAAARVGGIHANDRYPVDFLHDNLCIQNAVIDAAWRHGTRKLVFLGSSCIYPKFAPQPMCESELLNGPLEPTNQWYAIAKIAGIKLCQAYRRQHGFDAISLMPTNLYGPGDNFHPLDSHVLPALIRRFHEAKVSGSDSATIWGSGTPRREFLHVDDLASACVFLMERYSAEEIINVGVGEDLTILELAQAVAAVVGYVGEIRTDPSRPDGTPRKLLDVGRLRGMGWAPSIGLADGLKSTYDWFLAHAADARL
ncbi:MAG: GDP-L-fucose synthase [Xanthomonadales bacterium PRO6]|nr:GDP-L-fucose synthase [Xanthomonadales bacterium PRO6]